MQEGDSKVIELKAIGSDDSDDDDACDDLVAIKHMVHFFYHLDYDVQPAAKRGVADPLYPVQLHSKALASLARSTSKTPATADTDSTMTMHAKVFAAAVKYQVPALQVLAASKFASAVRSFWSHQTFAEAVRIVYHTTPDDVQELREVVADAITTHEELLDKPEIKTAVLEINGLAYELLRKKSKSTNKIAATPTGSMIIYHCNFCGRDRRTTAGCTCRRVCHPCVTSEARCPFCG